MCNSNDVPNFLQTVKIFLNYLLQRVLAIIGFVKDNISFVFFHGILGSSQLVGKAFGNCSGADDKK